MNPKVKPKIVYGKFKTAIFITSYSSWTMSLDRMSLS